MLGGHYRIQDPIKAATTTPVMEITENTHMWRNKRLVSAASLHTKMGRRHFETVLVDGFTPDQLLLHQICPFRINEYFCRLKLTHLV